MIIITSVSVCAVVVLLIIIIKYIKKYKLKIKEIEKQLISYENGEPACQFARDKVVALNINSVATSGCDSIFMKDTFQSLALPEQAFKQKYTKIEMIGKGSEAIVYKYQDVQKQEFAAVKIISQPLGSEFDKQIKELDILQRLQKYDGIIPIRNYVLIIKELSFQLLIIMDIAETSLAEQIQKRKQQNEHFTNEQMCDLLQTIVFLMTDVHDQEQIVHRDIKPSNILFINNKYKLSDFGVCKQYNLENFGVTQTVIGTLPYFSPQLRECYDKISVSMNSNNEQVDLKSWDYFKNDVFSFGLTMLYATTLKPVVGCNKSPEKLAQQIQALDELGIYSQTLIVCIKKMLMWNEAQRPCFSLLKQYIQDQVK